MKEAQKPRVRKITGLNWFLLTYPSHLPLPCFNSTPTVQVYTKPNGARKHLATEKGTKRDLCGVSKDFLGLFIWSDISLLLIQLTSKIHAFGGSLDLLVRNFPQGLSFLLAKSISKEILRSLRIIHRYNLTLGGSPIAFTDINLYPSPSLLVPFTAKFISISPFPCAEEITLIDRC